jgi:hypothetical protein
MQLSLPNSLTERDLETALKEFDDLSGDVLRSDHRTFKDNLAMLVKFQRESPFAQVIYNDIAGAADYAKFIAKATASVGGMVGSGRLPWPLDAKGRLYLQTSLLTEFVEGKRDVLEFAINFYYVSTRLDDNVAKLNEQLVRPYVREYRKLLAALVSNLAKTPTQPAPANNRWILDVLISHSSRDDDLAEALVSLLRSALNLPPDRIRCTSTPGTKLPVGANTDTQIKAEVGQSKVFVAILTPTSLQSAYVLFELGARWGKDLVLSALLARGATPEFLGGPMKGINVLKATEEADLHQFIENVADQLGMRSNSPASYLKDLKALVSAAQKPAAEGAEPALQTAASAGAPTGPIVTPASVQELSRHEKVLIKLLGTHINGQLSSYLANFFRSIGAVRLRNLLDAAIKRGWITEQNVDTRAGLTRFQLTPQGREVWSMLRQGDGPAHHE